MTTRDALLVAAALLLLIVAVIVGFRMGKGRQRVADTEETGEPEQELVTEGPTLASELYFPGPAGQLYTELRELPVEEEPVTRVEHLLAALLEGPVSEDLYPALPEEMSIGWIHLSPQSVLYVDLVYSADREFPAWGSKDEMLAVYSVVNTVLANISEVRSVIVLRNGQQRPTFAGHLDTSRPLLADRKLISSRSLESGDAHATSRQ